MRANGQPPTSGGPPGPPETAAVIGSKTPDPMPYGRLDANRPRVGGALRPVMAIAGAAMVIDAMLFSIMAPLLPYYKQTFGMSKAQAGTLAASYGVGTLIASLPAAALAVRINVKRTLSVGLALMAGASVSVGLAQNAVLLEAARFAQGAAGGVIWSASLAWVSELAPPDRRGAVLGSLTGIAIAGSLLGPPAGALAVATSPADVFSAIPVISLVLFLLLLGLPSHPAVSSTPPWKLLGSATRGSSAFALWLIFVPAMALGLLAVLGPLRLRALGAGAGVIAAIFVVAAIAESCVNPLAGQLSDRRGLKAVSLVGLPAEAGLLMLLVVPDRTAALAIIIVASVAMVGMFWAPAAVLLSATAKKVGVSDVYAFALFNVAWAAGQSVGASASGALAQITSDIVPCLLLAFALLSTLPFVSRVAR